MGFDIESHILLKWKANPDPDIDGYDILTSNYQSQEFLSVSKGTVKDTSFQYQIDTKLGIENIYFKIVAVDQHGNRSVASDIAKLARPQDEQLKSEIITFNPTAQGIRIGWAINKGKNVDSFTLERKPLYLKTWTQLGKFPATKTDTLGRLSTDKSTIHYIDATPNLEHIVYEYRLATTNKKGDTWYGDAKEIKPFDDNLRGTFTNVSSKQLTQNSPKTADIEIGWDYNPLTYTNIQEFKIYIKNPSTGDNNFYLHKTVKPAPSTASEGSSFTGKKSSAYTTSTNIAKSDKTNFTSMPLEIKIIALHTDGGMSVFLSGGGIDTSKK